MTKQELIAKINQLPDDAEIVIHQGDDILGDYSYEPSFEFYPTKGYKNSTGGIATGYSNHKTSSDKEITVWEIK